MHKDIFIKKDSLTSLSIRLGEKIEVRSHDVHSHTEGVSYVPLAIEEVTVMRKYLQCIESIHKLKMDMARLADLVEHEDGDLGIFGGYEDSGMFKGYARFINLVPCSDDMTIGKVWTTNPRYVKRFPSGEPLEVKE